MWVCPTSCKNSLPGVQLLLKTYKWLCSLQLLLPNCIQFSCCSLIASASAAATQFHLLQLLLPDCICFSLIASASAAAPQFHLLQLLISASDSAAAPRLHLLQLLSPVCICFSCCSPIPSTSAATLRLHPLELLHALWLHPLQLLLPDSINLLQLLISDCVYFSCCSQIAFTSAATLRLHPLKLLPSTSSTSALVITHTQYKV